MIPIKLELTNFLSYRETAVLDFDGVQLSCIAGPNGAGKSSLLDAITWALFGQSRSRSDDDLINRSAARNDEAAEIRFTFDLEGCVYRVVRRKAQGRSTALELQIQTDVGVWKPLSEGKLRETQAQIESLLRMNYDTFTNASFLLQGKADEFTTKTPNKRKEILADLLGVTQWDAYREAAATQRKEAEGKIDLLQARLDDITAEVAQEPERRAALEAARQARAAIVARLQLKEQLLNQMRQTAAAIEQQKQMVKNLETNVARLERNLQTSRQNQAQRRQERDAHAAILAEAETIAAQFAQWQEAEGVLQVWQEKAEAHNKLLHEKRPYEITIAQTRSRLEQELRELEARAQQVAAAQTTRQEVANTLANETARLTQLTAKLEALATDEETLHSEKAKLQRMQGERQLWQKELEQLQVRAKQIQAMAAEKSTLRKEVAAAQEKLEALAGQLSAAQEQRQRIAAVAAELEAIDGNQPRLREQMEKLKARIDQLQATTKESECPLCGQPLSEAHRQTVLAQLQSEGEEMGNRYRDNKARIKKLEVETKQLQATAQQGERLESEREVQQQRLAQAEARLLEVGQAQKEWETSGEERLVQLAADLADETAVQEQAARVAELEKARAAKAQLQQEKDDAQRSVSSAEARLAEFDRLAGEWKETGATRLAAVKEALEQRSYAPEAQAALADVEEAIAELGYNAEAHTAARRERDALAQAPQRQQKLQQAQAAVKPLEDTLAELAERIAEQEENLNSQQTQLETAVAQLAALTADSGDVKALEDEVFRLRDDEIAAAQRVGAATQRLAVLDDLREQKRELSTERRELRERVQRLKMLEKACGRNGVQALLIEQALPEIEEHANTLLERLTGGNMRVSFETQRRLKSRDALAETLDIRIADREGERPYDNYSGGEQFRVNFAIRLALSQLLAKRAGARLQTLVIDEGFGSQDPIGRQRLVEAINTIREDFACILVITHIDELRDAFPTRIEVEKTLDGSQITIQ